MVVSNSNNMASSDIFTKKDTAICKGIAVLMMLFHHLFNEYGEYWGHPVDYWPLTGDQVTTIALICKVCVAVFVFITGFGLAASYRHSFGDNTPSMRDAAAFSISRWWKLMSEFWPIFVLALVCSPLGRNPLAVYGGGVRTVLSSGVIDFLGLAEAFRTPSLNPTWWYMTLAITFIFIAPMVMSGVRAFGSTAMFVVGVLSIALFGHGDYSFGQYFASYLLGIFCYEHHVFEAWVRWKSDSMSGRLQKAIGAGVLLCGMLLMRNHFNYIGTSDACCALLLCLFVMAALRSIPVLTALLSMFGRHATNMFLVHTLMYSYYFLSFYYAFRFPVLILAVLAVTSMMVSIVLEKAKDLTGYRLLMKKTGKRVEAFLVE